MERNFQAGKFYKGALGDLKFLREEGEGYFFEDLYGCEIFFDRVFAGRTLDRLEANPVEEASSLPDGTPVIVTPKGLHVLPEGTDAKIWAREFIKAAQDDPSISTDKELMTGWFANAIMAGYDRAKREERQPE